jgi:hypothetical protein
MTSHKLIDANNPSLRTRVFLLSDVLDQSGDTRALRSAILEGACTGKYQIYYAIPPDRLVYSGPGNSAHPRYVEPGEDGEYEVPATWIARPNVKYVRPSQKVIEQFLQMDAKKSPQREVFEKEFEDGLIIPDDVSASSGLFEVTRYSARLSVSYPACLDLEFYQNNPMANYLELNFRAIYVDENTRDEIIRELPNSSKASPHTTSTTVFNDLAKAIAVPKQIASAATDTLPTATASVPDAKSDFSDDPYELKKRSDGVYILYRMAERYEQTFAEATNASERSLIAPKALDQLLEDMASEGDIDIERRKDLRRLFGKTRLKSAINLINPKRDHNNGLVAKDRTEVWPTPTGAEFLVRFGKRPAFINKTLALIIGGVGQWCDFDPKYAGEKTKQAALRQWLENHGLTNKNEIEPAYTLISGSRADSSHTTPKSLPPSPSNARLAKKSQKSRRRV